MKRRPAVAVWRDEWLPPTETFICHQMDAMARWRPLGVGLHPTSMAPLAPADLMVLEDQRPAAPALWAGKWLARRRIVDELGNHGARVVHAHFGSGGITARPYATGAGLPLLVTFHGFDATRLPTGGGIKSRLYRAGLRRVFEEATALIAVSDFIAGKLLGLGAPAQKIRVLPIGIPVDTASRVVRNWQAIEPRMVVVARLVEKKGVGDLLHAVSMLPQRLRPPVTVVGEGPLLSQLEQQALQLGVRARFTGLLDEDGVRAELGRAAIYCGPSKTANDGDSEGLGMVFLEAALRGLPVVAYRHGGVPEAVADGVTGLLATEGDIRGLALHLSTLLTDPQLAARMGDAGRQRVLSTFDIRDCTAALEDLYDEVARTAAVLP